MKIYFLTWRKLTSYAKKKVQTKFSLGVKMNWKKGHTNVEVEQDQEVAANPVEE